MERIDFSGVYTDITALNAVEAHLQGSSRDPWGERILQDFVKATIYADEIRIIVPQKSSSDSVEQVPLPRIALDLQEAASFRVVRAPARLFDADLPVEADLVERANLLRIWLEEKHRLDKINRWLQLHGEAWLSAQHRDRIGTTALHFPGFSNEAKKEIRLASDSLGLEIPKFVYLFDVIERFPIYNEVAEGHIYAHHPIRDAFRTADFKQEALKGGPPLSFESWTSQYGSRMSRRALVKRLSEMRQAARDWNLAKLDLDELTSSEVTKLARDLKLGGALKPKLQKGLDEALKYGMAAGTAAMVAQAATLNIPYTSSAITGAATALRITLSSWGQSIPGGLASKKALGFALHWPSLEKTKRDLS